MNVPKNEGLFVYTKVKFFKIKHATEVKYNLMLYLLSCCSSVVEHFLGKEEVGGSIPLNSSKKRVLNL